MVPESKGPPERIHLIPCKSGKEYAAPVGLEFPPQLVPPNFDGFEAAAAHGGDLYLSIEARGSRASQGYIARAHLSNDGSRYVIIKVQEIPLHSKSDNRTVEAITIYRDRVYALEEVNIPPVNRNPVVHEFDLRLNYKRALPLPPIPFRITDATVADDEGKFWVINFFWPGDSDLAVGSDAISMRWGTGDSHQRLPQVERLLQMQLLKDEVRLVESPPRYLKLGSEARNWEALLDLGGGRFFLATDTYPRTILATITVR